MEQQGEVKIYNETDYKRWHERRLEVVNERIEKLRGDGILNRISDAIDRSTRGEELKDMIAGLLKVSRFLMELSNIMTL